MQVPVFVNWEDKEIWSADDINMAKRDYLRREIFKDSSDTALELIGRLDDEIIEHIYETGEDYFNFPNYEKKWLYISI